MDKRGQGERDTRTKFITPALATAGWDVNNQIREEVSFTEGRIIVRGKMVMAHCDRLQAALTTTDSTRPVEALLQEELEPASRTMEATE